MTEHDRLAEIRCSHITSTRKIDGDTIWLIAEVERLRALVGAAPDLYAACKEVEDTSATDAMLIAINKAEGNRDASA